MLIMISSNVSIWPLALYMLKSRGICISQRTLCEINLLSMTHAASLSHSSIDLPYIDTLHSTN